MAPILSARSATPVNVPDHEISRSTIMYISAGAAAGLVVITILVAWLFRSCRRKRRIRERRKTRQAQLAQLQASDEKARFQRVYSVKTVDSASIYSQPEWKQPRPQSERWKWNPPGDPERGIATIQIPPNAAFF